EWFDGKFHNKASTVFSWGILPVFAGSAIQTNLISTETVLISGITATITYALIRESRPYKILKQNNADENAVSRKELFLKLLTAGVVLATLVFFIVRYYNLNLV
ncbi:MAG: hypothetical protein KC440_05585, partial [Nitrosarchaeum sp.]|nr:hypothetical protein [Nitrosarchaeum sp.]